jgi:hypothetical protein
MKKILFIASFVLFGCSEDEPIVDTCKTVTDKKIIYESIGVNLYAPVYYFFLDGTKKEVTKDTYANYLIKDKYCK